MAERLRARKAASHMRDRGLGASVPLLFRADDTLKLVTFGAKSRDYL